MIKLWQSSVDESVISFKVDGLEIITRQFPYTMAERIEYARIQEIVKEIIRADRLEQELSKDDHG